MPVLELHCSHKQVHPSALLAACQRAEAAGFDAAMSSDHFSPWSVRQGHSAFAWSWLSAALQATSMPFGVVNAPGQRYHPAVSEATAAWCAEWADVLITVNAPVETLRRMVGAYRDAGGRGDLTLQVHLSWANDEREADAIAHEQWRGNVFPPPACWDVDLAATFDAISEDVPLERVKQVVDVSADLGEHTARLAEYLALGFDKIFLHHVGQEQEAFVDAFGEKVLPQLRSTKKGSAA
jgi:alkanesulfonate monooxygenase SsuD/methylene tetrahydromethanopterin reductase-like flavin-dependent oxidoreductase (luciferase family)